MSNSQEFQHKITQKNIVGKRNISNMIGNRILILLILFIFSTDCLAQNGTPLLMGRSEILHSKVLAEDRMINIHLPDNYNPNDSVRYPIVYVLDGGIDEDFFHIAGIVRFSTQPWIDRFPQSIVVGIGGNTRRRDFTFPVENTDFIEKEGFQKASFPSYGGSEKYRIFLKNELIPYINGNFKSSGKQTLIGESLAGLFSAEILIKQPELFDDYIIISPSLWWGEGALLKHAEKFLQTNLKKNIKVYLGIPNKEEDIRMYDEAIALSEILKRNKKIYFVFDYMPDELHSTVIHQAVYNAFKKLYPKTAYSKW
jgi:predicted alpha/beta superfamily hydrolase